MKPRQIGELVDLARKKSSFYAKLYKNIPHFSGDITELPIISEKEYWKANSFHNNQVLTDRHQGILLRSGGTTGNPKVSIFSAEEWRMLGQITIDKLCESGLLNHNDHIANLFLAGNLYGSLLLMSEALQLCKFPILELPIGAGQALTVEQTVALIQELDTNVLMGTPYFILNIAHFIKENKVKDIKLNCFLYGGDLLLDSQYSFLKNIFPDAIIASSGYASTDSGFLGYTDLSCKNNEYRTDNHYTYIEIVEEKSNKPITEEGKLGKLIITNLTRILMPVIRYPVGDLAMWAEPEKTPNRKIKLIGRDTKESELIIVDKIPHSFQDFHNLLKKSIFYNDILGFQIVINKNNSITIKIALTPEKNEIKDKIKRELTQLLLTCSNFEKNSANKSINFEIINITELRYNERTFKVMKIIKE